MMTAATLHPCRVLWNEQYKRQVYGPNMVPVPEPIPGRAFFRGGFGLEGARKGNPLPPFPYGKLMVIGQDFQTVENYEKFFGKGEEPITNATWRPLLKLFREAGIDPADAFYTNAYLGLRGNHHQEGVNPDKGHRPYVQWCRQILCHQIEVQRPRAVLVLGVETLEAVAAMSPQLMNLRTLPKTKKFNFIDSSDGGPVRHHVSFTGIDDWETSVAVLSHPSRRFMNIKHRHFKGKRAEAAELLMLKHALVAAG